MRRCDFIKGFTASTTWPVVARAQQSAKTHRMALVHPSVSIADMSESGGNPNYAALFKELAALVTSRESIWSSRDTLERDRRTITPSSAAK